MTYSRLCLTDRALIQGLILVDPSMSLTEIGIRTGRHRSTIQREITRNGGRGKYQAMAAQRRALRCAQDRVRFLFDRKPGIAHQIRESLRYGWAPRQAARFANIAPETVYRAVYDGRLGLHPDDVLRTRRLKRKHRHLRQPTNNGNYLGAFTTINNRPTVIETRQRIGDWEGDLITGSKNQSAMISLVERSSRFHVVLDLPNGHSADATMSRIHQWLDTDPGPVITLTWDRGAELTRWQQLDDRGIEVFFCDPKSPWQRGSVENANRQLRFWFPKGTDLNSYTQQTIDRVCHILNHTHRRIHNWETSHHKYHHQTAH